MSLFFILFFSLLTSRLN